MIIPTEPVGSIPRPVELIEAVAAGSITDPSACNTFDPGKGFPCVWSTCSGVPDKASCGDYPVDQCPARLNCRVMQSEPVGT